MYSVQSWQLTGRPNGSSFLDTEPSTGGFSAEIPACKQQMMSLQYGQCLWSTTLHTLHQDHCKLHRLRSR